jgi:hypothetical protein
MSTDNNERSTFTSVVDPSTQASLDELAASAPRPLHELGPEDARRVLRDLQADIGAERAVVPLPPADIEDRVVSGGPTGEVNVGPRISAQVLFYPVTNADFDTKTYERYAEGPWLTRATMRWFWDAYLPDNERRAEITASPLQASLEQLRRSAAGSRPQRGTRRPPR